ncbi:MAG: PIG-L family deacetylase [Acidobacteriia bacterium]|nr:PIG-L family deacetylase [Terriglobia bacterium]
MEDITRRKVLYGAGALAAAAWSSAAGAADRRLKVIVVGAHPDDPESSCGGTMARYADSGHEVVALYLTRGEAGIPGKTESEAAAIRTAEAQRACSILKARAVFAGQIDGKAEINDQRYGEFRSLVEKERPDVVFAPWPIDSHRDHRVASLMAYDNWERGGRRFEFYYTEVDLGDQTKNFQPSHYVDITAVVERKRQACMAHESQDPPSFYGRYHEPMQRLRGLEYGCQAAEAFAGMVQNPKRCSLPG